MNLKLYFRFVCLSVYVWMYMCVCVTWHSDAVVPPLSDTHTGTASLRPLPLLCPLHSSYPGHSRDVADKVQQHTKKKWQHNTNLFHPIPPLKTIQTNLRLESTLEQFSADFMLHFQHILPLLLSFPHSLLPETDGQ